MNEIKFGQEVPSQKKEGSQFDQDWLKEGEIDPNALEKMEGFKQKISEFKKLISSEEMKAVHEKVKEELVSFPNADRGYRQLELTAKYVEDQYNKSNPGVKQ